MKLSDEFARAMAEARQHGCDGDWAHLRSPSRSWALYLAFLHTFCGDYGAFDAAWSAALSDEAGGER